MKREIAKIIRAQGTDAFNSGKSPNSSPYRDYPEYQDEWLRGYYNERQIVADEFDCYPKYAYNEDR